MQSRRPKLFAKPTLLAFAVGLMACLLASGSTAIAQQYPGVKCIVDGNQQCRTSYAVEFHWDKSSQNPSRVGKIFFSSQAAAKKFQASVVDKQKLDQQPDAALLLKANHQLALTGQVKQQRCPVTKKTIDQEHQLLIAGVRVCFGDAASKNKVESLESTWHRAERVFAAGVFAKSFAKQVEPVEHAGVAVADGTANHTGASKNKPAMLPTKR